MRRSLRIKRFIAFQAVVLLITMFLCIFLSSFVSYRLIKDDQLELDLATGGMYLNYCSNLLETKLISASREIYSQILTNLHSNNYFKYYINNSPFEKSNLSYLYDTIYVQKHLLSIRESNELLQDVSIFYIDNQMLISSSEVKYDAYFEFRKDELAQYNQFINELQTNTDCLFMTKIIDGNTLRLCRPIYIGSRIETLIFLDFSIHNINASLQPYLWDSNVNIMLLDKSGLILTDTSSDYTGQQISEIPYYSEELGSSSTGYYVNPTENGDRVINYIVRGDYSYLSVIPSTGYTDSADFILINTIISFLVALGVGLLLSIGVALFQSRGMGSVLDMIDSSEPEIVRTVDTYEFIRRAYAKMMNTVETQTEQLASVIPALQEKFVLWFFGRLPSDADEIRDNMEMMRVEYKHPHFVILAIKPELKRTPLELPDDYDVEFGFSELLESVSKKLNTDRFDANFCRKQNTLWGIVNFDVSYDALLTELTAVEVPSSFETIYFSVSDMASTLTSLSAEITAVEVGLAYNYLYPDRCIFTKAQQTACEAVSASSYAAECKLVLKAYKRGDADSVLQALDTLIASVREKGCNLTELKQMLSDILTDLRKHDMTSLSADSGQAVGNIFEFREMLKNSIERDLRSMQTETSSTGKLASTAKTYVEGHLTDNQLSLQYVADQLNVNATYLSAVFADTYGVTFIEYLTRCRIEYAKDLLANTDKPLAEIAELLNYSSSKYFISRFKAYCGVTPTMYRRQIKDGETSLTQE